ncbi:MAG: hypothetical protein R3A52_02730 [Polyangiales bacterium]
MDWAFIGQRDVPGGRRGLWLFVMVLSWSRMLFAECVWDLGPRRCASLAGARPRLLRRLTAAVALSRHNARSVVLARHATRRGFTPS